MMKELPIGIQDFEMLRRDNLLYVDKTARLLDLIKNGRRYFLSRPRRFGKSLTLSTLEAMFSGKAELFYGLSAEEWVKGQKEKPCRVIRLDMSSLDGVTDSLSLNEALIRELKNIARENGIEIQEITTCGVALKNLIRTLGERYGTVVILIDEYDKFILDNINNLNKAEDMRSVLRSFYTVLKSCDKYLRFVFITGISKFSKVGVFSAMNNLEDISMDERYGDIVGYTQIELEDNFAEWLNDASLKMNIENCELLKQLREYYDGFSFDGKTKLYNPFSVMQCLKKARLSNYWYISGSPTFIVNYMRSHSIADPETYRHLGVSADFSDSYEIERSKPESFLFQSGYLTIEKWEGDEITLDYPNMEVLKSITRMYLENVYQVERYITIGSELWKALNSGDILKVVELYNTALARIPYEDFSKRDEYWYRSLFLMLLRGAGINVFGELHTHKGRSDLLIQLPKLIIVLEFKFAKQSTEIERKRIEGNSQILERDYAKSYEDKNYKIITAVIIADDENHQVVT
ncbi:AAA family ATPase [bacterium]|nr:AAA family ATPase [bacterium]